MHPAILLALKFWGFIGVLALIFVTLNNIVKTKPITPENTPCRHYDPVADYDPELDEEAGYRAHA